LSLQYDREHSQTRGKSKEHIQNFLARIFTDRKIDTSGSISDPAIKESRMKALADLWINDRFIWELPVFKYDKEGNIVKDENEKPVFIEKPKNPFTGPYIRNALRVLFLEKNAEWKDMPKDKFTISQIAFVCTLVSSFLFFFFFLFYFFLCIA